MIQTCTSFHLSYSHTTPSQEDQHPPNHKRINIHPTTRGSISTPTTRGSTSPQPQEDQYPPQPQEDQHSPNHKRINIPQPQEDQHPPQPQEDQHPPNHKRINIPPTTRGSTSPQPQEDQHSPNHRRINIPPTTRGSTSPQPYVRLTLMSRDSELKVEFEESDQPPHQSTVPQFIEHIPPTMSTSQTLAALTLMF